MKTIRYAANEWGYIVRVCDDSNILSEYHAGNHRGDSNITVPLGDQYVAPPEILQKLARAIALEMGEVFSVPKKDIQYNSDLHENIYSFEDVAEQGFHHSEEPARHYPGD